MDKKKWLLLIVAVVLLIALVLSILALLGVFEPARVGLCLRREDSSWSEYHAVLAAKLRADKHPVYRCIAKDDQARQTQQVQSLLKEGCRWFIIEPVDTASMDELLQSLEQANARVVFINYQPEKLAQYPDFSYVGFDPAQAGQLQAQLVLEIAHLADHNGDEELSYAVLESEKTAIRRESCDAALQEENPACLEVQYCSNADSAREQCAALLSRYGKDLEVIFCDDDMLTMGALEAIEDGGRKVGEDIILIGANATAQTLELVKQGKLTGTLAADANLAASWVLQLLRSRAQVVSLTAYAAVSSGNFDDYIQWANRYRES